MSYHDSSRGRNKFDDHYSDRYSQHDDRTGPVKRGRGSRGGNYRGPSHRGGGSRGGSSTSKSYQGSRGGRYNNRSFRGRGGGFTQRRNGASSPFRKDDDGDINMDGEQSSRRFNPYSRPKPRGRGGHAQSSKQSNDYSWYQITIVHGENLDEKWLHQELQAVNLIQYTPVQYHQNGCDTSFFLNDRSAAEAIRSCNKQLAAPNGDKIIILMRSCDSPLTDSQVAKLKEVLSKRYDSTTQHLDASGLFFDEGLRDDKIMLKIGTPPHVALFNKIVSDHISSLVSIDLSNNALNQLDGFHPLVLTAPYVKKVNLAKNRVKSANDLSKIKSWDLSELTLDRNPLCQNYDSEAAYISEIREYFPNLMVLDGQNLPAPVKFDLEKEELPKPMRDHYPPSGLEVIENFVKLYFDCYDKSRSSLSEAYHEDAVFSLSVPSQPRGPSLGKYNLFSRNLFGTKHKKASKDQIMKVTSDRTAIITKFAKFPVTTHVFRTFCIDVPLATSSIVNFVVRGMFQEGGGTLHRAFSRSFICQVSGARLFIINEQYFVRNPTSSELKELKAPALSSPTPAPSASPVKPPNHSELIAAFAKESGMNGQFSEQCLAENGWDYKRAGEVFLQLKARGSIPAEAFK